GSLLVRRKAVSSLTVATYLEVVWPTTYDGRRTTISRPPVATSVQKPETTRHESDCRYSGSARVNPPASENAARDQWAASRDLGLQGCKSMLPPGGRDRGDRFRGDSRSLPEPLL